MPLEDSNDEVASSEEPEEPEENASFQGDSITEITELGGLQHPTLKFLINATRGMMALLLPNATKNAERLIYHLLTPALMERSKKEGSEGVTAELFMEVTREVVVKAAQSKRVVWDASLGKWMVGA